MLNILLTWLASLRTRLIATYMLVTAISFGFLLILLMKPVEQFMTDREEQNLIAIAATIGSTIRNPWRADANGRPNPSAADEFLLDQFWTQKRFQELISTTQEMRDIRFRMLDTQGKVLADSHVRRSWRDMHEWLAWVADYNRLSRVDDRLEVYEARHGNYSATMRPEEQRAGRRPTMYIALPIKFYDAVRRKDRVAVIMYLDKPVETVQEDLRQLRHLIRYGMVVSLLITLLGSILLAANLSAGLRSATQIARTFANGQMDQRMRAHGRDEVGQLGAAFNQMADALQRHEQLRRDLLADVSHELRTPLTAIAGCADTLAEGAMRDPETAERFLEIILRESERLQRMVSDILELSKLQSGVISIPRRPIPLYPVLEDAVEIACISASQHGITIRCAMPNEEEVARVLVLGNEDRLTQAFRNLLDNAVHHTPAGKSITVSVLENEAAMVRVDIRDEGAGISPDDIPFVFDRFYRSGKGGSDSGGTGLGLAIVQEIVRAHDGRIDVQSTPGCGTTFSLYLPKAQAEVENDVSP